MVLNFRQRLAVVLFSVGSGLTFAVLIFGATGNAVPDFMPIIGICMMGSGVVLIVLSRRESAEGSFTQRETRNLYQLLEKVADGKWPTPGVHDLIVEVCSKDNRVLDEGLKRWKREGGDRAVPDECLVSYYDCSTTPFYELVFYRKAGEKFEYLLAYRNDQWWNGFHVMGGRITPGLPADPVGICEKLMGKEFREHSSSSAPESGIKSVIAISSLHWKEHPWCHPVAVVYLVEYEGEIKETPNFRFFSLGEMPENMLPNHGAYLYQCEAVLRTGRPLRYTREMPLGIPEPVTAA